MQSGRGNGRNPTSSSASPTSSSNGASAPASFRQLGLHQQQQLLQQLQQQQLRRAEGEETLLAYQHGVTGGSNFPPRNLYQQQGGPQPREENQNRGQVTGQHSHNPIHQSHPQFAFQAAAQQQSLANLLLQQQGKIGMGSPSGKDQEMIAHHPKMQHLMSLQAASQSQQPFLKKSMEEGQTSYDKGSELKPPSTANVKRPMQSPQPSTQNAAISQLGLPQLKAIQAWAQQNNIDLSVPANMNLMNQLLPLWQSARLAALQKQNEPNTVAHQSRPPSMKPPVMSSPAGSENSAEGNSVSELSGQVGSLKGQSSLHGGPVLVGAVASGAISHAVQMQMQQSAVHGSEDQNNKFAKSPMVMGNVGATVQKPTFGGMGKGGEQSHVNSVFSEPESLQPQHLRPPQQLYRPLPHPAISSSEDVSSKVPPQAGSTQMVQQHIGFTKQQQHVLKAQILAFRRIKRGDRTLPQEVLAAIVPPPLDLRLQQTSASLGIINQERPATNNVDGHTGHVETSEKPPQLTPLSKGLNLTKEEPVSGEEKVVHHAQGTAFTEEHSRLASVGNAVHTFSLNANEVERSNQNTSSKGHNDGDKGKSLPMNIATAETGQLKKPAPSTSTSNSKEVSSRKYHGPLFDFPYFNRRSEPLGSTAVNCSSNFTLGYDVKDLLFEEGISVLNKKRTENLKKINSLLAVNLERKRIKPDIVLRLQIKEKKLRLLDLQAQLRDEVDQQQQEIMAMSDRPYRKFVRECERQRVELSRQVQQLQKLFRDKQLKSIFQWRKKLLEAHWAIRDARTTRNRGVAKYHEKMLREFSKRKDNHRNRRMEALKNNDVDRYREMLLEQQTSVPGDAAQRYAVLSSFLSQTEEYLLKLGGKITASKANQEVEEAANAAARAARSQGLSEEEAKAAAACAREEVMIRNRFSDMNTPKDSSSVNKYYNLAHAVNERVAKQPSMLRMGTLRDYQLVGLQWMLSLYNNKLNGILADEMGLGKTVQVMALIAYLMEFKGNYGPHLIIVPNAVLVNWKSELHNWLPSAKCIFYVGRKDQRTQLFSHEVVSMKFNILVTTYEFIMYDRSKLSKVNWKYIIIDEAQRMKDRESVLARDLDRYSCQRRLLLTGTPLQNDLKELWSLLNLLLPEVFDNRKAFHDWFSQPFQRDGPSRVPDEDDWLETEKKVIIIHRLHQILEPFMLRRRVEDVEGALPPKVPIVLRCKMSAIQGAIYDWIKSTGTVRVDPEDEMRKAEKNPMYQVKMYKNLNNKCMELRKVCNHPLLNYPYFNDYSKDFLVRSCGKLWVLDRILIKLQRAGHRVLLFSTMTKLLDLLEEYLQWRRLVYRRIDGTTSLEDREAAIVNFNSPDSDSFIFLLSIRAAGRGLNLQSADTVVIYDPDPNPQNEEQAVARAHRIGQTREVKVIYMEAVVDKISSFQKEDELRNGGSGGDLEDDLVGKDRYMGSIESLIRNNIQQYKIDMADEVINAGRFDQRTTHEERRMTLESLLHDEDRDQETVHDVPSLQEVNRMIARSEEEVDLFDQMDEEFDWTRDMVKYNQVPRWLRAGSREVDAIVSSLSKKPSKNILTSNIILDATDATGLSSSRAEKRRGRPKGSSTTAKRSIYVESDDEDDEDSDASSNEGTVNLSQDEEGGGGENEDEFDDGVDMPSNNKDHSEEEVLVYDGGNYDSSTMVVEGTKSIHMFEGALSTGSTGSRRLPEHSTPSTSSQKFGSLSALDDKPGHLSKRTPDELEEGEIAASGDSCMDIQQSGNWIHDRDEGEEEQVLQPKLKRKRSIRVRPKYTAERLEEQSSRERNFYQQGPVKQSRTGQEEIETCSEPVSQKHTDCTFFKQKRNFPSRKKSPVFQKSGRLNNVSGSADEVADPSDWPAKSINSDGLGPVNTKMSESMQRKCKNVVSKFKRRIDKDGHQIVPILFDLWKRNGNSSFSSNLAGSSNLLDLYRIEQRVDSSYYNGVMDFIADVQSMLETVVQYSSYSPEVGKEAGKLQDLFFDIMKIAFPDTDLRRARISVTFSNPGGGPAPSNQSKVKAKTIGKEPKPSATNLRERSPPPVLGPPLLLAHPGDLVICKKKRKDRDKQRVGPASPLSNNTPTRAGPLSPPIAGWAAGGSSRIQEAQWAKPVKRTRTDAGKRRPSHL